jgi:hypothetical protein
MGWGSMLVSIVSTYRKTQPTASKGVLKIKDARGRTCLEVAKNETVVELVSKKFVDEAFREQRAQDLHTKFKLGAKKVKNYCCCESQFLGMYSVNHWS